MTQLKEGTLNRREVVARILRDRGDALIVTGLGSTCWDAAAAGDHLNTFYLWGAMGGAAMVGLGLALAQPRRRVLVITGDGEMLMGLGALATIGVKRPANLAVIVIDNEHYGETGMQQTHTRLGVDLTGIATAAGWQNAHTIRTDAELETLVPTLYQQAGPIFAVIKVGSAPIATVLPPREGPYLKTRFRESVLGKKALQ